MKWQIVHTPAGWHLRLRASNGEPILTSEVYTRKETAKEALFLVLNSTRAQFTTEEVEEL